MSTNVFIVGHLGYIGSFLCSSLSSSDNYKIATPEGNQRGRNADVGSADVVIYLGGIVGHQKCASLTEREVFDANVGDIMRTATNMKPGALLIYSSTAALYEGHGLSEPKEDVILHEQLFDRYMMSMYHREKNLRTLTHIRTAGLRLGTVIGISPNQKKTSIHIKMLRDAVLFGKVRVQGAHMGRSILSMHDLKSVVERMIEKRNVMVGHQIYNMCSFNCTVAKIANEIGCLTGSNLLYEPDNEIQKRTLGFSMNNEKITHEFGFQWQGRNGTIVKELIDNIKHVCYSCDYLKSTNDGTQCRVCKQSENMAVLYDFEKQPNANHYLSCPDDVLEEYPLRLDVCRNCYHTQISYTIPPEQVFSNYIYLSGTSNTMREFFREFADKSIAESGSNEGNVLEIACNDGSLLDWYKARGWKTFGYDPARNIYEISSKKGHDVTVGFWGQDPVPTYPPLDIIVAQNVCAHVPDPVAFLTKCREVMNEKTILYVQTSQSEMIEKGQYDTAYHEHLSFFTVRSMDIAAKMAGLCLDGVEKTEVHGSSYIFRIRIQSTTDITQNAIYKYEKDIGLYDDLLYYVYVEKVRELSKWLHLWEKRFKDVEKIKLVGYGAAAKGMTILNSLRWVMRLDYVADDSKLKQGYWATNRKYPIVAPSRLLEEDGTIAVYVPAWNFIEEIKRRVVRPGKSTYFLTTYPQKTVWFVDGSAREYKLYEEIDTRYTKTSIHHHSILITHFYNEDALLTQWIRHHASLFDCAVLIDYNSTDKSRDIIKREAPDSWNVVSSYNREFGTMAIDAEVSGYENSFNNNHWRLALTTTEFLFATGLRRKENSVFKRLNNVNAIRIPSLTVVDDENAKKNDVSEALLKQKNRFYFQDGASGILTTEEELYVNNHYNRFMHCIRDFHNPYHIGRHDFKHVSVQKNMHILKYVYGPFPEFYSRKLQIKTRMPESDKQYHFGHQHLIEYEQLDTDYKRKQQLPLISSEDEQAQMRYFDKYMREVDSDEQLLSGIYANLYNYTDVS